MARVIHPRRTRHSPAVSHRTRGHEPTRARLSTPVLPGSDWPTTPRDLAVASTASAALVSALLGIALALSGGGVAVTVDLALFPLVAAVTTMGAVRSWLTLRRRSPAAALAATTLVLAVGAGTQLTLSTLGRPPWRGEAGWMGAVATLYAILAALLTRLPRSIAMPHPPAARVPDDARWCEDAARALRSVGVREPQVRTVVADARDRAEAAGRPIVDELGSPARYAAAYARGAASKACGTAWRLTLVATALAVLAAWDLPAHQWSPSALDPWATTACIGFAAYAAATWRAALRARPGRSPRP